MDLEVVYEQWGQIIISKVIAIQDGKFLILGANGYFQWVPAERCQLRSYYETAEQEAAKQEQEQPKNKKKKINNNLSGEEVKTLYDQFIKELGDLFGGLNNRDK